MVVETLSGDQPATLHHKQLSITLSKSQHQHDLLIASTAAKPNNVSRPLSQPNHSSLAPGPLAEPPLRSMPVAANAPGEPDIGSMENSEQSGSYGLLVLTKGGRSKYLGPTAGSEWLKDSETQDNSETPLVTRAPTPEVPQASTPFQPTPQSLGTSTVAFPFNGSAARISTQHLLSCLPQREEASTLVDSYYRYCAWHHDVAPRTSFQKIFDRVYALTGGEAPAPLVNPQELALVFVILAQGTMYNIEMASYDSSAEEFLHLAERALVKGDFLLNHTVPGLQTLHLMAHIHLCVDLNCHPSGSIDKHVGNLMQVGVAIVPGRFGALSYVYCKRCMINPEHCDTAFPTEPLSPDGGKSYYRLRFELSQLSYECASPPESGGGFNFWLIRYCRILNMAMKVRKPAYADVTELDQRLCEFERNIPYNLRSRAALLSMPSRYPRLEAAIEASPEPSRRSMTISFQQMNLALNTCETIINLHRPYYAKALYDDVKLEGKSFHVFNSALCLGTLVLRDPGNGMGTIVIAKIDASIALFTSLIQHGAGTPRYQRNLQWLQKLRARAMAKIASASAALRSDSLVGSDQQADCDAGEDREDLELVGWRTRLIQLATDQKRTTTRTVRLTTTGRQNAEMQGSPSNESGITMPTTLLPISTSDSTDDILHDFWDPIILQDVPEMSQTQPNSRRDLASLIGVLRGAAQGLVVKDRVSELGNIVEEGPVIEGEGIGGGGGADAILVADLNPIYGRVPANNRVAFRAAHASIIAVAILGQVSIDSLLTHGDDSVDLLLGVGQALLDIKEITTDINLSICVDLAERTVVNQLLGCAVRVIIWHMSAGTNDVVVRSPTPPREWKQKLEVRLGGHFGDDILRGGDVYRDGLLAHNVLARLSACLYGV
ncbi:hypothetical protein HJFPF1_12408 [Paramyrothecium foliicola]|nr:hypothetical protein HJFPF1_12408 [Paramyrothecium foliicola]